MHPRFLFTTLATLLLALPAAAHHSRAGFTLDRTVEMKATITKVRWSNPHVFFEGIVSGANGRHEEWVFEGHSISGMVRAGWNRDTVKAGDQISLMLNLHRDPAKHFALVDNVVLASGQRLYAVGVAPAVAGAPQPKINPSTDFSGNWRYRFPGTPEQVRQRILLGASPPTAEGPYTDRARSQIRAWRENDNPTYRCLPISLPSLLMTVYEYKWIRYPDRIEIRKEQYLDVDRTIWLDPAKRPALRKADHLGVSTGRFEADGTLVVETSGFSPQPWGIGSGVDSSAQKRIVERYRLINNGMGLELSYTVEDPVYLTAPLTATGTFTKSPDSNFAPQPRCDLKAARQHIAFEDRR
ncbi:MAG: DUF6152 family protein [Steroidobacteraceae bacterium]